jgi:hypothetical protein
MIWIPHLGYNWQCYSLTMLLTSFTVGEYSCTCHGNNIFLLYVMCYWVVWLWCENKKVCFYWEFTAEYPFLNDNQQVGKALCSICNSQLSIGHGGFSDMPQHIKKRKHRIAVETKSCSSFANKTILMIADILQPHNHCFRSTDCTSSVTRILQEEIFHMVEQNVNPS